MHPELTVELPIVKPGGKYSNSWALEVSNESTEQDARL
jgi:hypothetical protein